MLTLIDCSLVNCCTYSCSYCISRACMAYAENFKTPELDCKAVYATNGPVINPVALTNWIADNYDPAETIVQLSGGEPLLHPGFIHISLALQALGFHPIINTNGNQVRHLMDYERMNEWDAYWRCSWHPEFRNFQAFLNDIEPLPKDKVLITYVLHPLKMANEKAFEAEVNDLADSGYRFELCPFQGELHGRKYQKTDHLYDKWNTALKFQDMKPVPFTNIGISANGCIRICHRIEVGNIYSKTFWKRVLVSSEQPRCELSNGNTSCGFLQTAYQLKHPATHLYLTHMNEGPKL